MAQNVLPPEISEAMGKLIDTRGAILIAFAQVEWFLAKLVAVAATYDHYKNLDLSFSQDAEKRAQRLREILDVQGPFSKYADSLKKSVDDVLSFAQLRNFCTHGLLVRPDDFRPDSKCIFGCFGCTKAVT